MTRLLSRAQEWINSAQLEGSTLTTYAYSLGLLARGGIVRLDQVNRATVRRWTIDRLQEGASAATVSRNLAALCSFLGWLEQLDEFPLPELEKIRTLFRTLSSGPPPPPDFLTPEEFKALLSVADTIAPELRLAVAIGVHTGLRLEEIRTLWRSDFELVATLPYVRVQRTHGRKIKTKNERTVPISRAFADELLARGFLGEDRPVFPRTRLRRAGEDPVSHYLAHQTLQGWLRDAVKKGKLYCNWITFRHTYASWLVQNDVSIVKVAKFLGNGILVCFQHYGALIPGGDKEVEKGFAGLKNYLVHQ